MKVRIKPVQSLSGNTLYYIQCKKWWGWKTIRTTFSIENCFLWMEDLKKIANVEFLLL